MLGRLAGLGLLLWCALPLSMARAAPAPVAVFPFLNVSQDPNGIDLPFTQEIIDRLAVKGIVISPLGTVVNFMAHNRIRTAGQIETFHLDRIQEELGAPFVLVGAIVQSQERPAITMGITLSLVRAYDGRTVWSYAKAVSIGDIRKPLGIGEATSVADLQALLVADAVASWPTGVVTQEQQSSATIDSMALTPTVVKPGVEIHATVRLRNLWPEGRAPRIFFRADEQLHAGTYSPAGNSYEATWIAGEKDGRFPVTLVLEWPLYGRTESLPIGSYLVDGVLPLVALELKGESLPGNPPVFRNKVMMFPSLIVRKSIARWRITVKDASGKTAATQEETGNIPTRLSWSGAADFGFMPAGVYTSTIEVWDEAGNTAAASAEFEMNHDAPVVTVVAEKKGQEVLVDLQHDNKVPLAYWRLEMWSEEGRLLKTAEGQELGPKISVDLPAGEENLKIEGVLVTEDILGNRARQEIKDFFPPPSATEAAKEEAAKEAAKSATKAWVNDF